MLLWQWRDEDSGQIGVARLWHERPTGRATSWVAQSAGQKARALWPRTDEQTSYLIGKPIEPTLLPSTS